MQQRPGSMFHLFNLGQDPASWMSQSNNARVEGAIDFLTEPRKLKL